jgi:hypothetical protein
MIEVAEPRPISIHASYAIPQEPPKIRPRKVRETDAAGFLIEIIGLLFTVTIIGAIIGIPLLVIGGRRSIALRCGQCGNKIESEAVTMCPVCKCSVGKPIRRFSFIEMILIVFLLLFAAWVVLRR